MVRWIRCSSGGLTATIDAHDATPDDAAVVGAITTAVAAHPPLS